MTARRTHPSTTVTHRSSDNRFTPFAQRARSGIPSSSSPHNPSPSPGPGGGARAGKISARAGKFPRRGARPGGAPGAPRGGPPGGAPRGPSGTPSGADFGIPAVWRETAKIAIFGGFSAPESPFQRIMKAFFGGPGREGGSPYRPPCFAKTRGEGPKMARRGKNGQKMGSEFLSRLGELLNTQKNVHRGPPRGPRGVPPGTPPPGGGSPGVPPGAGGVRWCSTRSPRRPVRITLWPPV